MDYNPLTVRDRKIRETRIEKYVKQLVNCPQIELWLLPLQHQTCLLLSQSNRPDKSKSLNLSYDNRTTHKSLFKLAEEAANLLNTLKIIEHDFVEYEVNSIICLYTQLKLLKYHLEKRAEISDNIPECFYISSHLPFTDQEFLTLARHIFVDYRVVEVLSWSIYPDLKFTLIGNAN